MLEFENSDANTVSIAIANLEGQIIFEAETAGNGYLINADGIPDKGIYFVTVRKAGTRTTQKLVVH
jgi:hypothetical protein